jgi:hypothetical protein
LREDLIESSKSPVPPECRKARWMHATDYRHCQALADTARAAKIEIIRYRSVRDPGQGINLRCSPAAPSRAPKTSSNKHGIFDSALREFRRFVKPRNPALLYIRPPSFRGRSALRQAALGARLMLRANGEERGAFQRRPHSAISQVVIGDVD